VDNLWRGLIGNLFGAKPPPMPPAELHERRKARRAATSVEVTLQWKDSRGEAFSAPGVLENVSQHGFAVRTGGPVKEGHTVWVTRPESPALKSVVRNVRRDEDGYVLGFARIVLERRREDRRPVMGTGVLRRMGTHGETVAIDTEIRNISAEGVQVAAAAWVPTKEVARLVGTAVECIGSVRYCVPWKGKFLVGLFLIGKPSRRAV
jgi:hypothetical protein